MKKKKRETPMSKEDAWHLSKSVPITLVLAIIMQTVALVWYVSTLDSAIKQNSKDILRTEVRLDTVEKIVQSQAVTLGRMDENIKAIRTMMQERYTRDSMQ
jgi:predicted nucleotide-binding protein (sugar kinase/HSP70/actin superfamily)